MRPTQVACLWLLAGSVARAAAPAAAAPEAGAWVRPTVVRLDLPEASVIFSPLYGLVFGGSAEGQPYHVLLRPGDTVAWELAPVFPYRQTDGASLVLAKTDAGLTANGKLVMLHLGDSKAWDWLRDAGPEELACLRVVGLAKAARGEQEGLLQKLADSNLHVGLWAEDVDALDQALYLFRPQWLHVEKKELKADLAAFIATQDRLEWLSIDAARTDDLAFLARMPALRTLVLSGWEPRETGRLPDGLPALRSLILSGGKMRDLAPLGRQPRLRELTLWHVGGLADLGRLADFPLLHALALQDCGDLADLEPLRGLLHLRWLALPPNATPRQLEDLVRDHPDLEVLAALGCGQIGDLTPVRRLGRLEALLVGTPAPLDPVYRMRHLRFVAVSVKGKEEEAARVLGAVQQALPEAAVSRVAPICLGSGWILLVAPAAALGWWLARRRRTSRSRACPA